MALQKYPQKLRKAMRWARHHYRSFQTCQMSMTHHHSTGKDTVPRDQGPLPLCSATALVLEPGYLANHSLMALLGHCIVLVAQIPLLQLLCSVHPMGYI
uniref:ARAD1C37554p n=1 Tax=Blastobotrys adeninivorans TaxID=409370 RepID=A0A060T3Z0_BLAAD